MRRLLFPPTVVGENHWSCQGDDEARYVVFAECLENGENDFWCVCVCDTEEAAAQAVVGATELMIAFKAECQKNEAFWRRLRFETEGYPKHESGIVARYQRFDYRLPYLRLVPYERAVRYWCEPCRAL